MEKVMAASANYNEPTIRFATEEGPPLLPLSNPHNKPS